ncbi:hypothetical protein BH10PSE12_BH10PSE12_18760 [soil metagenome]
MAKPVYVYEMNGGECYGYFDKEYLYTAAGQCTHYRGRNESKYLYTLGGVCEFYQQGKYFYSMQGGQCRWWIG